MTMRLMWTGVVGVTLMLSPTMGAQATVIEGTFAGFIHPYGSLDLFGTFGLIGAPPTVYAGMPFSGSFTIDVENTLPNFCAECAPRSYYSTNGSVEWLNIQFNFNGYSINSSSWDHYVQYVNVRPEYFEVSRTDGTEGRAREFSLVVRNLSSDWIFDELKPVNFSWTPAPFYSNNPVDVVFKTLDRSPDGTALTSYAILDGVLQSFDLRILEVPEPSTIALIGMALLSLFGFGLMRRQRSTR